MDGSPPQKGGFHPCDCATLRALGSNASLKDAAEMKDSTYGRSPQIKRRAASLLDCPPFPRRPVTVVGHPISDIKSFIFKVLYFCFY